MATEMECFRRFFEAFGVKHEMGEKVKTFGRAPVHRKTLRVAQTYFLFDEQDKYLGAMGDDLPMFEARATK